MKGILQILNLALVITVLFTACAKETDKFTPYSTSELSDLEWSSTGMSDTKSKTIVAALQKSVYTNSFNSNSGITTDFSSSLQLQLPAYSYTLNSTNFNGNINTKLVELSGKGDFIRNLIPNCNDNGLYDVKAVYQLKLTNNAGDILGIQSGMSYNIKLADVNTSTDYKFIDGVTTPVSDGSIIWSVADSIKTGYLMLDNAVINGQTQKVFNLTCKKQNWISVAKPINFSNIASSDIILSGTNFTNKNTVVFAVFNDYNTVLKLDANVTTKTFAAKNLPVGANITLVSVSYIDGQFYLGKQAITVSNVALYTIKPAATPVSVLTLSNYLDTL